MADVVETEAFSNWLQALRDQLGRRAILRRLGRIAATDHFGDHASVGGGVSELRIDVGPGYRVDYTIRGGRILLLLGGGDKGRRHATSEKRRRWRPDCHEWVMPTERTNE